MPNNDNDAVTVGILKNELGHVNHRLDDIVEAFQYSAERQAKNTAWRIRQEQWRETHEVSHVRLESKSNRNDVFAMIMAAVAGAVSWLRP